ncbi:MAG: hypothetical protein U0637_13480 [Phycisphaerales bacterium]
MSTTPFMGGADALRLIGSGGAQQAASRALIQQLSHSESFQNILDKAREGAVASGLKVKAGKESGLTLTQDQVERLSAAADIAEANGAGRAVFLIDGRALRMDVGTRTVLGPVDMSKTGVLGDIDAIVSVAADQGAAATPVLPPPAVGANASLLRTLAQSA